MFLFKDTRRSMFFGPFFINKLNTLSDETDDPRKLKYFLASL